MDSTSFDSDNQQDRNATPAGLVERVRSLHEEAIVIDAINVSPLNSEQIARYRKGGINAVFWSAVRPQADWDEALRNINSAFSAIDAHVEDVMLATCADDITRAKSEGRLAIILGLQNARSLGDDLSRVSFIRRLGLRIVQLTYNERNFVGDGCVEPTDGGLSRFGKRLVAELNAAGILIDLSHCSVRTTLDAASVSSKPVIVTHGNARSLCDTPRNKTDEELRAVAESGGFTAVTFWAPLSGSDRRPNANALVGQIEYIQKLGGDRTLAVGTDHSEGIFKDAEDWIRRRAFGEGLYPETLSHVGKWYRYETRHVEGLESIADLPQLTETLFRRGFGESAIRGILGGNFLRTFRSVCG
jgi:membrane dipeptidase